MPDTPRDDYADEIPRRDEYLKGIDPASADVPAAPELRAVADRRHKGPRAPLVNTQGVIKTDQSSGSE